MANWLKGEVVEKREWTDGLFSLRIKAPLGDFIAGQFVRVGLEVDGEILARPYSLVNAPDEALLEIYFNVVTEGDLSIRLARLEVGELIYVSDRTSGFLTINEIPEAKDLWMLATGTGVGPFLSCLKTDEPWQRFDRIILGYSVKKKSQLAYAELISSICHRYPEQMSFVPFVTRETMPGAISTRITTSIENGELEDRIGLKMAAEHSHVMMCGNADMISQVSALLEQRGMHRHRRREPGHITTEKYH